MAKKQTVNITCPSCGFINPTSAPSINKNIVCDDCNHSFDLAIKDLTKWSRLIGELAIKYKTVTKEQYDEALSFQKAELKAGRPALLHDILRDKKMMTPAQTQLLNYVGEFFELKRLDKKFCNIAVQKELIKNKDIKRFLTIQEQVFRKSKSIKSVGDLLVEAGTLTLFQRDQIFVEQKRISKKALENYTKVETADDTETEKKGKLDLIVSENKLETHLQITGVFQEPLTVEAIQGLLEKNKIKFGVVTASTISRHISVYDNKSKKFKVALGQPVKPGKDASIEYYFDTEYKKTGRTCLKKTHKVKAKELLAEKIPMKPGRSGIDIYGNPIVASEQKDILLWCGKCARLSKDGLKVFATKSGNPRLAIEGKVSVFTEDKVSGDANIHMGPINSNSNIQVTGMIPDEFVVRGGDLSANEIRGADIEVLGDIKVTVGITGARIKTQGSVSASYIRNSKIDAFGDIIVKNEIIDSRIFTSGLCRVTNSRIISSSIFAKRGIHAKGIGTDVSSPCNIGAGFEKHLNKEIQKIDDALLWLEEDLKDLEEKHKALKGEQKQKKVTITELKQLRDEVKTAIASAKKEVETFKDTDSLDSLNEAENALNTLKEKKQTTLASLKKLASRLTQLSKTIATTADEITKIETQITERNHTREAYLMWAQNRKNNPIIETQGVIVRGTIISGNHASTRLKKAYRSILVREKHLLQEEEPVNEAGEDVVEWEIEIISQN